MTKTDINLFVKELFEGITVKDCLIFFCFVIFPLVFFALDCILRFDNSKLPIDGQFNKIGWFLVQLSLIFITISVMSIFSETHKVIYWEDVVERMLILPKCSCFKAYCRYSFGYLFGSMFTLMINKAAGWSFLVFFIMNVVSLTCITWKMLGCYYGDEKKKRKYINDFIDLSAKARETYIEALNTVKAGETIEAWNTVKVCMEKLDFYTNREFENKNYLEVNNNLEAYGKILFYVYSYDRLVRGINHSRFLIEWFNERTVPGFNKLIKCFLAK